MRNKQLPILEEPTLTQRAAIVRYLDEHAKFLIAKDLTFEIHMRSWSEEILQLVSMVTYRPVIGAFCIQARPLFTLKIGWQSAENLLKIVGGGYYQSQQIAIVREFVETKKAKQTKKLTGQFRQNREEVRLQLLKLNYHYFTQQYKKEEKKYQPKLLSIEDYIFQSNKDRRDFIAMYEAELREKQQEKQVKRQFRKKIGITTIELQDFTTILIPQEQIRYQKLVERACEKFKIRERTAKEQVAEAVKQKKLIRGGKPHTPAAYFMLNTENL